MTKPDPDRPEPKPPGPKRLQDDRLAQALRENLKRRKAVRPTAPATTPEPTEDPPKS